MTLRALGFECVVSETLAVVATMHALLQTLKLKHNPVLSIQTYIPLA